jgi:hypothetical protein
MKKVFLQWPHQNQVLAVSLHWPGSGCALCAGQTGTAGLCNEITEQDLQLSLEHFLQKHSRISAFISAHQGGNGDAWLGRIREYLLQNRPAAAVS